MTSQATTCSGRNWHEGKCRYFDPNGNVCYHNSVAGMTTYTPPGHGAAFLTAALGERLVSYVGENATSRREGTTAAGLEACVKAGGVACHKWNYGK